MAGFSKPGPLGRDLLGHDDDVLDNVTSRSRTGAFAPQGTLRDDPLQKASWHYEQTKLKLRSQYSVHAGSGGLVERYEGVRCIFQAAILAEQYAPIAILRETGYELGSLLKGLIPGLLQMLALVGATTFLGGLIGGIIGAFAGGVGAVPGAAVGAEIGFDIGMAALTWLGLAFFGSSDCQRLWRITWCAA